MACGGCKKKKEEMLALQKQGKLPFNNKPTSDKHTKPTPEMMKQYQQRFRARPLKDYIGELSTVYNNIKDPVARRQRCFGVLLRARRTVSDPLVLSEIINALNTLKSNNSINMAPLLKLVEEPTTEDKGE